MRILKENALAMVIDVQEKLFPHIHDNDRLEKNLKILIEGLKVLKIPMVVTEQYKKGLGDTIEPIEALVVDYPHNEKTAFSCCDEPSIMEFVELSSKRVVILAGVETHVCLLQTALDLLERGYKPVVVEDCVSSRSPENKRIALKRMEQEGVLITSYESILFELCRFAGAEGFKTISKLVK
jgi:nicotinamidase-related amidase